MRTGEGAYVAVNNLFHAQVLRVREQDAPALEPLSITLTICVASFKFCTLASQLG